MTKRISTDKSARTEALDSAHEDGDEPYSSPLTSKDRKWWWATGFLNTGLFIVPLMPLSLGIQAVMTPTANVKLDGAQQAALNAAFELNDDRATTVRRVVVELDHPSIWDRLLNGGPALLLTGVLILLAYALWRIEVNTTAGPHQRPFTAKDQKFLTLSARSLWCLWWVVAALEVFGPKSLHMDRAYVGPVTIGSLVIFGLALLTSTFVRVYTKGRRAYTDMEQIV